MSWLEAVPQYLLIVLLLVAPGVLLSLALGLRGLLRWAAVVPLSVAGFAASAVIFGMVGLPWNPWTVMAAFVVVAVLLWLALLPIRRRRSGPWSHALTWRERITVRAVGLCCGAMLGTLLVAHRIYLIIQRPDAISQTYDANFHYNAVRYILDTGRASSLTLGGLGVMDKASFYPAAWHDAAAFVMQVTGFSAPVVANAMTVVLCAVVWVLGGLYLATRLLGDRPVVAVAAGLMASSFPAFPYLLSFYGNLFPNTMSIAMMPLLVGMLTDALNLSRQFYPGSRVALWLGILLVTGAMGLAHPSTVVLTLAVLWIMLVTVWWRGLGARRPALSWLAAGVLVAALWVLQQIWFSARASFGASSWKPHASEPEALGEALAMVHPHAPHLPWALVAVVLLGAAALLRRPARWIVAVWLFLVWLYVLAASSKDLLFRYDWTGVWYNDANRLMALIPVAAVVLGTAGCVYVVQRIVSGVRAVLNRARRSDASPRAHRAANALRPVLVSRPAGVVGCLLAVFVGWQLIQGQAMTDIVNYGRDTYGRTPENQLLSPEELELLEDLPRYVTDGSTVFGNPLTGTSQAYAVAGVDVLIPHPGLVADHQVSVIAHHLDELKDDPEVCPALKAHDVHYVLDFGTQQVNPYAYFDTSGYDQLTPENGFELVAQTGPQAKLYRITGCK